MDWQEEFYLCPHCFRIAETSQIHHQRRMLHYPGFPAGHDSLKPPHDEHGDLTSRAPRWFIEQRWQLARR